MPFSLRLPFEELKQDRPLEYAHALKTRVIKKRLTEPPPRWLEVGARDFGLTCLAIGIMIIIMIIYSMTFLYR